MKQGWDFVCDNCMHGTVTRERITADPYNSYPAEYYCTYDFDCPYEDDEDDNDTEDEEEDTAEDEAANTGGMST